MPREVANSPWATTFIASEGESREALMAGKKAPNNATARPQTRQGRMAKSTMGSEEFRFEEASRSSYAGWLPRNDQQNSPRAFRSLQAKAFANDHPKQLFACRSQRSQDPQLPTAFTNVHLKRVVNDESRNDQCEGRRESKPCCMATVLSSATWLRMVGWRTRRPRKDCFDGFGTCSIFASFSRTIWTASNFPDDSVQRWTVRSWATISPD